jgi:hypothetical protein
MTAARRTGFVLSLTVVTSYHSRACSRLPHRRGSSRITRLGKWVTVLMWAQERPSCLPARGASTVAGLGHNDLQLGRRSVVHPSRDSTTGRATQGATAWRTRRRWHRPSHDRPSLGHRRHQRTDTGKHVPRTTAAEGPDTTPTGFACSGTGVPRRFGRAVGSPSVAW